MESLHAPLSRPTQALAMDRTAAAIMAIHGSADADRREAWRDLGGPARELSFGDLLDVINPLQHIPIVANIYRALTGDTISGAARIVGATLYGGPIGMLAGMVDAIVTQINGANPGDVMVAGLFGIAPPDDADTALAAAVPETALAGIPEPAGGTALETAAPPLAASFAPRTPGGALTGNAALAALFGDLRVQDAGPAKLPSSLPGAGRLADADRPAGALPTHAFTHQMMQGLDKYRQLALERGGAGRPAPQRLDQRL